MENDVLYNRIMNVVHSEYGDGSTAVANPTGEPTDSLETIQIGDDIYSISGGGGGGGMLITVSRSGNDSVLDKTYAEIKTAFESGIFPVVRVQRSDDTMLCVITDYGYYEDVYQLNLNPINRPEQMLTFTSATEDGILTAQSE